MMPVNIATSGLLKIKVYWNKGYDIIIYIHDVTSKVLVCDSIQIVDVVMWTNFGNSSISIREGITISKI